MALYVQISSLLVLVCLSHSFAFVVDSSFNQPSQSNLTNVCQLPDSQTIPVSGGCNFNNGTCGYEFPPELWSQHTESAGAIMFGSVTDDNSNGIEQTFALFLTTEGKVPLNTSKSVITPTIYVRNVCLRFWYLIPNQNSELRVYVTDGNKAPSLVWEKYHQLSSQWKKVEIPIHVSNPFVVSFESTKENNLGYVGVDSVSFDIEPPTTTSTTTAPTTTTATTTQTTTTASTARKTTATTTFETSTTTFSNSQTAYNNTKNANFTITTGTITVTHVNSTSSVTTTDKMSMTPVPTQKVTTSCKCQCPTVQTTGECRTTTSSLNFPTTTDATPVLPACVSDYNQSLQLPGSCDFNRNACGYNIPSYPHLWELTSYRYSYGGPNVGEITGDHSVDGTGGYMVFNSNNKHVPSGVSAEMMSQPMETNSTICMEFWYNMPNDLSTLEVHLIKHTGDRNLIWRGSKMTHGWQRANVLISFIGRFQVSFLSKKFADGSFSGIDDVVLSLVGASTTPVTSFTISPPQIHQPQQTTSTNTGTCNCICPTGKTAENCSDRQPTTNPLCSSNNILVNVSCDFDTGPCGFNIPMYPHLWMVTRYDYGEDINSVITGDHTTGGNNGMYAVFSTDNEHVQIGSEAEMTSQQIKGNVNVCLTFWYNMPTGKAVLEVYKRYLVKPFAEQLLWKQSHLVTKGWKQATIMVHSNKTFQLVFSSNKTGRKSYLGIDDIRVHVSSV